MAGGIHSKHHINLIYKLLLKYKSIKNCGNNPIMLNLKNRHVYRKFNSYQISNDIIQYVKYAMNTIIKLNNENQHVNKSERETTADSKQQSHDNKQKDFSKIHKNIPPKFNLESKPTSLPVYSLFVSLAMLLTFNYEPSSKIIGKLAKLDWYQFIEAMLRNGNSTAITVYPNSGIVVSPSLDSNYHSSQIMDGIKHNVDALNDRLIDGFSLPSKFSFLHFPSTNYLSEFIDYIVRQSNMLYENLDIVYRPIPFDDYWTFATLPFLYAILSISKNMTLKKSSIQIPNAKIGNNITEALNEKFGEEHMVKGSNVKFNDVIGCDEAKMEISEFVSYMKYPEKFEKLNARIPTGAILHGPPGTGKTLLAKALATECDTKFFACSGSDFVQMFVGVGAARVRNLFETARKNKPAIIFIDEIDAVATDRSVSNFSFSEKESTLNQLLSEMDGFGDNKNVIVIAGTNKFNYLDKAILRPGRFDRHIYVGPPDITGRENLFKYYMKPLRISPSLSIDDVAKSLAKKNPGFTGASIANICNEAAIIATREKANFIDLMHFDKAADRIRIGAKTGKELSHSDRHIVAIHEAGHAVVGWNLLTVNPLNKVTIVPRGNALGFAQYEPSEMNFMSQQQLYDQLVLLFGGRAAEDIILNEITTSARDDIEKATKIAYQMTAVYGMDPDLENLSFYSLTDHSIGFFGEKRVFGNTIGDKIDKRVTQLLDKAYNDAKSIIKNNDSNLLKIAKLLEQRETVQRSDIENVLGPKKYDDPNDYLIFPIKTQINV